MFPESLSISSYPDEYSSKIDLFIESVIETSGTCTCIMYYNFIYFIPMLVDKCIFITDLYLKAVVGVVRLHAPRALQVCVGVCVCTVDILYCL